MIYAMATIKKKKVRLKEPVKVRTKKLADGSESVYLDIYVDGQRRYEFLKLYLLPEINAKVKEQNKETLAAVETIKSQRIIEITKSKAGLKNTKNRSKISLADWMQTFIDNQKRKGVRGIHVYESTQKIVEQFRKGTKMWQIDKQWCIDFIDWLQYTYKTKTGNNLTPKSANDYLGIFSGALNAAVRDDIIPENPMKLLTADQGIKVPESQRQFLTIEEIKLLTATPCKREDVKMAYLFACYCGLRISDVRSIKWSDIIKDGDNYLVGVIMQKTRKPIYIPLSKQALGCMPEKGEAPADSVIFSSLPGKTYVGLVLREWMKTAGITKHITFHTSRHTFATTMLTVGGDLYTTSKLLGHSSVRTTQIYAKIIDSKKIDAVNLIDKAFEDQTPQK